jgi:hypothetical protein
VFGRDGRAADDVQVDSGGDHGLVELLGALRRERRGDGDTGGADLGEARGDEFGLDRLGVDLAHARRRGCGVECADLFQDGLGVLVARPDALEVEHADSAELAHADGRGR